MENPKREFLRHSLATLAYRGNRTLTGAPEGFGDFRPAEGTRSAAEILAHIGDLLDWAIALSQGRHEWRESLPMPWLGEIQRVFAAIQLLDAYLASAEPLLCSEERILQGPVADALTHFGQIALLRRMAGSPVRPENYFRADIVAGVIEYDR